jgi:predicted ribosomally synthesized peptide with nif11-like leader
MSIENVVKFYELVAEDEGLQDRMKEAVHPDAFLAAAVAAAGERGLEFTTEELRSHVERLGNDVQQELSDENLNGVAGGGMTASFEWTNTYSGCANCSDGLKGTISKTKLGRISTRTDLAGGGTASFEWTNTYSGCANC